MKKYFLNAPQKSEITDDTTIAEMVLDKALRDFQKERLLKEIDLSLEKDDKDEFMRLTEELKEYLQ